MGDRNSTPCRMFLRQSSHRGIRSSVGESIHDDESECTYRTVVQAVVVASFTVVSFVRPITLDTRLFVTAFSTCCELYTSAVAATRSREYRRIEASIDGQHVTYPRHQRCLEHDERNENGKEYAIQKYHESLSSPKWVEVMDEDHREERVVVRDVAEVIGAPAVGAAGVLVHPFGN